MSETRHTLNALALADIDVDGALREAADRLPTRGQFLRRGAGVAAAGLMASGLLPGVGAMRLRVVDALRRV